MSILDSQLIGDALAYICDYVSAVTLVQIAVDIAVEVVSRHTLIGRVGLCMRGWRVRLWPKGAGRSVQVKSLLCGHFRYESESVLHSRVAAPPLPSFWSAVQAPTLLSLSSASSSSSSSDFRGRRVRLRAPVHPHHCGEKAKRNTSGSGGDWWWYLCHLWFMNLFLIHTIIPVLSCTNAVCLCFPLSSTFDERKSFD